MALEDLTGAKYLDSLVVGNPVSTDDRREGDDHIRGIKNVLRNTFPNLNGPVTATDEQLSGAYLPIAGGTVTGPLVAAGGVTLGDAAGDALAINSSTVSIPNGINFSGGRLGVDMVPVAKVDIAGQNMRLLSQTPYNTSADVSIDFGAANPDAVNNGATYQWRYMVSGDATGQSLAVFSNVRAVGQVERMRIGAAGHVFVNGVHGLGITSTFFHQVQGSYLAYGDGQGYRALNAAGNGAATLFANAGASGGGLLSGEGGPLLFEAGAAVRMRIEAAGVASFLFGTKTQRTWQAVGASRNFNTDYTAPAYDIELSSTNTTTANSQSLELVVNGVSVASDFNAGATNTCIRLHGHVIPAGATYRINATANITKGAWSELR